jgi:hypothetical protein
MDWRAQTEAARADGLSIKWIGCDENVWHLGGFLAGREGAWLIPPVGGLTHVPFESIWNEPAYGPPRFERHIDKRREVDLKVALASDSKYGWFDTNRRFWDGCRPDRYGWLSLFSRAFGDVQIPMLLFHSVETELDEDPDLDGVQVWNMTLAADGEPRWRRPDIRPAPWINDMSVTTKVKQDENLLSPFITVGVGKFKVANRGNIDAWPIVTVGAPGRCWISDGSESRMVRVPPLAAGEHVVIDTDPSHRIAISLADPLDNWLKQFIRNSELLSIILGNFGESGVPILERFHGQGFQIPAPARTVTTITVYHDTLGARVSVRLPQRYESAIG